jgi:hypothetical protein
LLEDISVDVTLLKKNTSPAAGTSDMTSVVTRTAITTRIFQTFILLKGLNFESGGIVFKKWRFLHIYSINFYRVEGSVVQLTHLLLNNNSLGKWVGHRQSEEIFMI